MTTAPSCPACNRDVPSEATFCMHCGARVLSTHNSPAESEIALTTSTPRAIAQVALWPTGNLDIKPTWFPGDYKVKREYTLHLALSGEKSEYVSSSGILVAAICHASGGWAPDNRRAEKRSIGELRKLASLPASKVHLPMMIDSIFGHSSGTKHAVILDVHSDDFSWRTRQWYNTGGSKRVFVWEYRHGDPVELKQSDYEWLRYKLHVWFLTSDDRILYNHTSVDGWKG